MPSHLPLFIAATLLVSACVATPSSPPIGSPIGSKSAPMASLGYSVVLGKQASLRKDGVREEVGVSPSTRIPFLQMLSLRYQAGLTGQCDYGVHLSGAGTGANLRCGIGDQAAALAL